MRGVREFGPYKLETLVLSAEEHDGRSQRGLPTMTPRRRRASLDDVGSVYLARNTADHDKRVAVKLLGPQPRKDVLTDLKRDIRTIAARNDARLPVLDLVDEQDRYALVMTYVKAPSLAELVDGTPLPPVPAVAKAAGVAAVLVEAGVPHGHLRPSNILVDGQGRVYVVGWDTARTRGKTPRHADDVRSLALVLLSMLLGRAEVDEKAVDAPEVQGTLRDVIRRALTTGDYTNVAEFVRAAGEAVEPDVDSSPPPLPPPPPPPSPRRARIVAVGAAAVAVLLVGALALVTGHSTPSPPGVVDVVDVGGRPLAVVSAASGSTVYVAGFDDGVVTEIDGGSVSRTFRVPGRPAELALAPGGTRLYVGDPTTDSVATVDLAEGAVVRTERVAGPRGMFVGPSGHVYVAASESESVTVLDPAGGTTAVPVTGIPVDVFAGPDAATVVVVTQEPSAVLTVETATHRIRASVQLDDALVAEQAVMAPNGVMYVSDPASSAVTVVDLPNKRTARIALAGRVRGLALTQDGHRLYVTLAHPVGLTSVDLTVSPPRPGPAEPLPDAPASVAVTADGQDVLVALTRRAQVVRLTPPGAR